MIFDYLDELLGTGKETSKGDEKHWCCPICGDRKYRMYINRYTHRVYCQNCGYSGTVVKLISDVEKIPYRSAFSIYKDYNGVLHIPDKIKDEVTDILKILDYEKFMTKSAIPLPEDFTLLDEGTSMLAKRVRKYLHTRLVTDRQITLHGFGYCYEHEKYAGRAILPIYENKDLQFWVARAITKDAFRKELSPSDEEYQISKSEVLFNIDRAVMLYGSAVLCEGIFDAITFGDIGVGMLGKALHEEQLNRLLKYKDWMTNGVYLSIDEDAWRLALDTCDILYQYMPVYLIRIKGGDPNAIGRKACMEALANAVEYTPLYKVRGIFNL